MARSPVAKALEAAAEPDAWLVRPPSPPVRPAGASGPSRPNDGVGATGEAGEGEDRDERSIAPSRVPPDSSPQGPHARGAEAPSRRASVPEVLAPAHTDWLYHHLAVAGPVEDVARFRAAAAGAGVVPWSVDWDRLEEDWAHLLLAPPPPQRRALSAAGARVLAGELREAAQRRHEAALARVGRSRVCPLDLHALVPVPADVLALGPDHPDALAWLWAHWGTTQPLRHVQVRTDAADLPGEAAVKTRPPPRVKLRGSPGRDAMHLAFWSADWTPWRAIARVREDWPTLRLGVRPIYEPG